MGETVEAIYDFKPQNEGDIELCRGARLEILEHLSADWCRGRNLDTNQVGVFPTNYVKEVENQESKFNRPPAPAPDPPSYSSNGEKNNAPEPFDEKKTYEPPPASWMPQQGQESSHQYNQPSSAQYQNAPQQYYQASGQQQAYQQGYQQYPSQPLQQYQQPPQQYQQPQVQMQQQQQQQQQQQPNRGHPHLKAFAQQFAGSVMWGAGATVGSDAIHKLGF